MQDLRPRGDYLMLIDASSIIHRNYHALPKLQRQDGMQTGALYGFANTMLKLLRLNWSAIERLPKYAAIILDVRGPNWRHGIFPDYKAQRKPYEAELLQQLPYIPVIAEAFNVMAIGKAGQEADDLIATYVQRADEAGVDTIIVTSDKDLCQLVGYNDESGTRVTMYDGMKDKGREDCAEALVGEELVLKKWGVRPDQVADLLAIAGDSVDNVPGVKGVGPKGAAELLTEHGSLPAILDAIDWAPDRFRPKLLEKLREGRRDILMSRQLVQLNSEVEVDVSIDELLMKPADSYVLRALFMDLEWNSLVEKVDRPPRW